MQESKRVFYRTIYQIELLSEEPFSDHANLYDVANCLEQTTCSGKISMPILNEPKTAQEIAALLRKQNKDPATFRVDDQGRDLPYSGQMEEDGAA